MALYICMLDPRVELMQRSSYFIAFIRIPVWATFCAFSLLCLFYDYLVRGSRRGTFWTNAIFVFTNTLLLAILILSVSEASRDSSLWNKVFLVTAGCYNTVLCFIVAVLGCRVRSMGSGQASKLLLPSTRVVLTYLNTFLVIIQFSRALYDFANFAGMIPKSAGTIQGAGMSWQLFVCVTLWEFLPVVAMLGIIWQFSKRRVRHSRSPALFRNASTGKEFKPGQENPLQNPARAAPPSLMPPVFQHVKYKNNQQKNSDFKGAHSRSSTGESIFANPDRYNTPKSYEDDSFLNVQKNDMDFLYNYDAFDEESNEDLSLYAQK